MRKHTAVSNSLAKMLWEDSKSVLIRNKYPQADDPASNETQLFSRLQIECLFRDLITSEWGKATIINILLVREQADGG